MIFAVRVPIHDAHNHSLLWRRHMMLDSGNGRVLRVGHVEVLAVLRHFGVLTHLLHALSTRLHVLVLIEMVAQCSNGHRVNRSILLVLLVEDVLRTFARSNTIRQLDAAIITLKYNPSAIILSYLATKLSNMSHNAKLFGVFWLPRCGFLEQRAKLHTRKSA